MNKIYMRKTTKLIKDIKELYKWKDIACSWSGRLSIVKMSFFFSSTWYINSDVISVKVPGNLFLDIDKLILKYLYGETKDPKELSQY